MGFPPFPEKPGYTTTNERRDSRRIEYTFNDYKKAMEIHDLKASLSFVEVILFGAADIVQSLITHDWTKATKGMLSVKKA